MRIGLDGIPLAFPKTGVGHYTFELAQALTRVAPEYHVELVYPSTFAPITTVGAVTATRVPVGPIGRHWWSTGLPRFVRNQRFDLFHGTNYDVPLWRRCPTVLTVHDLSLLLYPETHEKRSVKRARRRLPLMVRTADAVIVPTAAVRQDVAVNFGLRLEKVFVVHEAARECFTPAALDATIATRQKYGIGDEFILTVGTIEPRKNLETLIAAFEQVVSELPNSDVQLVLAGGRGWLSGPVFSALDRSPARSRVVLTEYLHDADLRDLYSSCRAFVYPSLYEGFGLPPLEAMACGAPVIASSVPALIETTADAALLVEPKDVDGLSGAILEVLRDGELRAGLIAAGQQRVKEFSWDKAAVETLAVYESVL
jgi:glycosyltransferase involved in cell wall biosynthesis